VGKGVGALSNGLSTGYQQRAVNKERLLIEERKGKEERRIVEDGLECNASQ
jgi:hypothetical protein